MRKLGKFMYARGPFPSASGKTLHYDIISAREVFLGEVRWYGPWRCYSFFPDGGTIYNAGCMQELVDFCKEITDEHRQRPRTGT